MAIILVAWVTVPMVPVAATVTLAPPTDRSWAWTVSTELPVELARAATLVAPLLIRLMPLKLALLTTWVTWLRSEMKSVFSAARLAVSSEVSEAARAFDCIWDSRSETWPPAARATSVTEDARFSESFTASSEEAVARWFWAMAQMAPSSFAEATFRPVLMMLCTL